MGPAQLAVIRFEQPDFSREILEEFEKLRESDTVRVSTLVVFKHADGDVVAAEISQPPLSPTGTGSPDRPSWDDSSRADDAAGDSRLFHAGRSAATAHRVSTAAKNGGRVVPEAACRLRQRKEQTVVLGRNRRVVRRTGPRTRNRWVLARSRVDSRSVDFENRAASSRRGYGPPASPVCVGKEHGENLRSNERGRKSV